MSKALSKANTEELLQTLELRFKEHTKRHPHHDWPSVEEKLKKNPAKLRSLKEMEDSGGEPDVVDFDSDSGHLYFFDCSPEAPAGRRNLCYDKEALDSRKKNKPESSAVETATAMGCKILSVEAYKYLQTLGEFDLKTSTWVETPAEIRKLGGAIFCDRRYGQIFTYHNGADSYYSSRGFRTYLKI